MKMFLPNPNLLMPFRGINKAGTSSGNILAILILSLAGIFFANFSFAQSTPATAEDFALNSTANSTIGIANPNHWYKLVTNGDGNITLSATASQANGNTYMYIYIYDSDGTTQLGSASQYASNGGPSLTVNGLAKGTYYCLVSSGDNFNNTYSLTNSLALSPTVNDVELNDFYIQALTINQNDSAKGHIGYRKNGGSFDQSDVYKLVLTTDANVSVSYKGDFANPGGTGGGNGYAYIYLYDQDTTAQLGNSSGFVINGGAIFSVNGLAAGTYYIKIDWGGNSGYFTGYTLTNVITSPPTANDAELNDYFNQALIINQDDSAKGHIGYRRNGGTYDQSDVYKLIINTDANVSVSYKGDFANPGGTGGGNGYAYIYLYDKDTTTQLGNSSGFVINGGAIFSVNGLAAGTYYIKINWGGNGGYFTGYTLTNIITSPPTVNDAEPNDYFNQSLTINQNDSVSGHIGYRRNGGTYDQGDIYKLVTSADGNVTISYTGDFANPGSGGGNGFAYLYLYDKDTTTQLGTGSGYVLNGGASFIVSGLAAGTYYAKINWGGSSSYFTGYKLKCKLDTAAYVNDVESNNTTATASLLNLNPNKSGHIGYRFNGGIYDTDDYWKIVMNTSDSLRVVVDFNANGNANAFVYVYLYNEANNQLFQQSAYVVNQSSYNIYFPTLAAGNYYLKIGWGGSGAYYSSYTIPVFHAPCDNSAAVITAGGPTTFCQGNSVSLNTTPTFTAYGQSNGYSSYLWSNAATTQNITVTSSGSYSVETKDVDGCVHTSNVIAVTVNPIPATPTISTGGGATTFCQGGSVTLTSSAATGNTWSNGATTQSITVSSSGSYTVSVTANGCTSNTSAATTVTVNPLPSTPTISAGGATTFCQGGSVTLTSSSATSYLWSNGATTQSINVNTSGSYSVVVKNANGCSSASSSSTTVTVNPLPATPTISADGPTTFCQGGRVALTSSSATGNVWSTGATTQSINITSSGNYSVTVTNGNGCSAGSAVTTVTVNPLPTVSLSSFNTVCTTDAAFNLSGGSPAGGTYSGTGVSGGQFNPATAGAGTFPITYSYTNANGCTATATQSITVTVCGGCTPTVSPNGPTTFCAGGSVTLTSSAASSYLWSNGASSQSITVSASGSYTVTTTNANNCTATSAATVVTVNPLPTTPTISAGGPTTFCAGGSVTLSSSAATGNVWSNGATTQSITVNASGSYSVTVSNGNCSATSAATVVTVNPLPATPTISAGGPTTFCAGGSVTLTSSAATGNVWSNGATTQSITVNASGSYTVTITNGNNCSATSAATVVTVNPLPTVALATFAAVCNTDAAFTLSGGSPAGGTYSGTGVSAGQFNPATAGVGTFTITYSYTNSNGCSATATRSITVNNCNGCTATILVDKPTTFCQGGSVTLTASAGNSYLWSNGATTQSITVSTGGSYTVSVTNGNCSATSAAVVVTVNPLPATPIVTAGGPTTFCAGGSVTLTSSAANSYSWSNGATTQSITVNAAGNYSVTVKNAAGCAATSVATAVGVNAVPTTPTITAGGPTTFCQGESVTLTSSAATSYLWNNGATTQSITVTSSGNYSVTVKNAAGCSATSVATTVTANNCGGAYCLANGNSKNKGYISNVYLRTIFNTTGWSAGGYGNYLNQSTTLSKRYDYIISVTPGYGSFIGAAPLYTRVWIDFNQDGDFNDAGELVFAPSGASYFLRLGVVNIPNSALNGSTRMRVAMRADAVPTSCGSFAYGEVEDYTVVIGNSIWYRSEQPVEEPAITLSESFNLYPNPVSNELVIQRMSNDNSKVVATTTDMQIMDMNGRMVLKSNLAKSTEVINVRNLPNGIYMVRLRSGNTVTTKKIIVSH